ncbi:MAG: 5'-methylthioadenosine/S-adenosylhomocysteine nucleosidase [Corynebacteriales bacterium]|nr:5'-methylthioadenosine/S-adenosylhomocysteine nucleosidase [Mycobacteriales bacterium]
MNDRPVVVLTALNLEYQAVREKLTNLRVHTHREGTRFEIGYLAGKNCQVVLGLTGKGNQPAAVLAERAKAEFNPLVMLFVGVAGALRARIRLGDVVVATHVYAFHGGTSQDDGLKARPRVWEVSHAADQIARHVDRTGGWVHQLSEGASTPKVFFGPIAAGEIVLDSAISDQARWIKNSYNDALAIEMEAAGIAQAGHLNRSLPVIVVRGISDRADGTKHSTDRENWQPRAAANAATFAAVLIEELFREFNDDESGIARDYRGAGMNAIFNNNGGNGGVHIGIQAANVHELSRNNVSFGRTGEQDTADLTMQLTELKQLLDRLNAEQRLGNGIFLEAQHELNVVNDVLPARDEFAKNKALAALKKLYGLTMDVAEVAGRVLPVIEAVRGL